MKATSPPYVGSHPLDLSDLTLRELESIRSDVLDEAVSRTVEEVRENRLSDLTQGQRD